MLPKAKYISMTLTIMVALPYSLARAAEDAKDQFEDIEISARAVADQADELSQISLSQQMSSETHLTRLMAIKEDVNRMGREIAAIETERDSLPKWEQRAYDKVLPLLKETASSTQSAIEFADQNRTRLWSDDYRGYTATIWRDSRQVAHTIRDYLKYERALTQEQVLQQSLGMGD